MVPGEVQASRSLRGRLVESCRALPSPFNPCQGRHMKAFRMEWVNPHTGHRRVTIDCGINKWHAESGSRALLPDYQLVDKQPLGEVRDSGELASKYKQAMAHTCLAASDAPYASDESPV